MTKNRTKKRNTIKKKVKKRDMHWYERLEKRWELASNKTLVHICVYTGLFLVTFLLAYSPFFEAGKSFIWIRDGRDMYYPTIVYIGRYLRQIILNIFQGKLIVPTFDINISSGSDIFGSLNLFGFGDPLNLVAIFVPTMYTEYLYNLLHIIRLYFAGLSFFGFCVYHKKEATYSLIGAIIYVFSGYAIFNVTSPFFINPMIQLPLLLIGVDFVIKKQKPYVFLFSLFYVALCGFYFLFMMTIFIGAYVLIQFLDYYSSNRFKEFLWMVCRIIRSYTLGLGLAAILFFPAVLFYLSSSRSGYFADRNFFSYGWNYYQSNFLRIIAPSGSFESLSLAAIVLFALVLLFNSKKGNHKRVKIYVIIAITVYAFPLGGYIMHGFSYPSQRWTFGFAFLLSYCVVEMLPVLLHMNQRQFCLCFVVMIVYSICVFISPYNRTVNYIVGVAFLAITLSTICTPFGAVLGIKTRNDKQNEWITLAVCITLVVWNVSVNAIYKFAANQENFISQFSEYGEETKLLHSAIERELEQFLLKNPEGRADSSSFWRNRGMVWKIPTAWSWWSMTNSYVCNFWEQTDNVSQLGMNFKLDGTDQRTIFSTLLSTKYFIEKSNHLQYLPYGYFLLKTTDVGNQIYENKYALPWGYTYDSWISYKTLETMSGLEKEEAMLQSITLENDVLQIQEREIQSDLNEIPFKIASSKEVEWDEGVLRVHSNNASIALEFEMPSKVEGYLYMKQFDINQSGQSAFDILIECESVRNSARITSTNYDYYFGKEDYLFNLGYSDKKRTGCTITFPKKGTYKLGGIELYALPMDNYPEYIEALRAEPLENIEWSTNCLTGTVDLSKDKVLCVSVPYSKGWSATVDGKRVEILRGNYMFMALPLTAGHHDIEFTYCSPGLKSGIVVTIMSWGILLYKLTHHRKKGKQKGKENGTA